MEGEPSFSARTETMDAPASILTTYTMLVGDSFSGTISSDGDRDWISITLAAGETYHITLDGRDSGLGNLSDPFLRLYDSTGVFIAEDDDSGNALNAALRYTATDTGTYYLSASAWADYITGGYQLSVTAASAIPFGSQTVGTLDELSDFLISSYWETNDSTARSFDTSRDNQITVNLTGLTAAGQQLARWAFQAWERVADLVFVTTSSSSADIIFDDSNSGAYATSATSGSTILSSTVNVSTDWLNSSGTVINSYSLQTYIHEIGHALGLGHQGAYNGEATYGIDETFSNDSWQVSVMSYFSQVENTTIAADEAYVVSAMMADIVAIQALYGAPDDQTSETAGDTTWGTNTTLTGTYLYDVFGILEGRSSANVTANVNVTLTIYDVGGTDTIDLSNNTSNDRIDMNGETYSDVGGLIGNLAIARGTVIENLTAGSGNDTITGNAAENRLNGGLGHDVIAAGAGADTVWGESGNDNIDGGIGADSLIGQDGNDTLLGGSSTDILRGDGGNDSLVGGTGDDTIYGGDGDDSIFGNTALDTIYGGNGNDYISSGDGIDYVDGGAGNDTIYGRSGWDSLFGGDGDDSLIGSEGDDQINGGNGNDWVSAGSAWDVVFGNDGNDTLYGNFGSDVLSGGGDEDELYGGTGDDTLRGGDGNDSLYGNQGVDRLDGGAGNDLLRGGTLRDTFVFAVGYDADEINDFEAYRDRLELTSDLVEGRNSGQDVLDTYASIRNGMVVFDFGDGDILTLSNLTSLSGLVDTIEII